MTSEIVHDPSAGEFAIVRDGARAYVIYQREGTRIDITNTYVPDALRRQGLAEKLVRATLTWAKAEGLTPTASCWYAEKFIR